jgi:hypothetical protein
MTSNVAKIPPRRTVKTYRQCKIELTFDPFTKRIKWKIVRTVTRSITLTGDSADWARAERAAKSRIDKILDGE